MISCDLINSIIITVTYIVECHPIWAATNAADLAQVAVLALWQAIYLSLAVAVTILTNVYTIIHFRLRPVKLA
jgi:hypothetical protein